jgi:hypothetical protein
MPVRHRRLLSPETVNLNASGATNSVARQSASWREERGTPMKKVLFALVATLVAVSVSGCAGLGKGKAPPSPPIVTKG